MKQSLVLVQEKISSLHSETLSHQFCQYFDLIIVHCLSTLSSLLLFFFVTMFCNTRLGGGGGGGGVERGGWEWGVGRGRGNIATCEPQSQKTYLRTCSPSEDSDQTAHSESFLVAFLIAEDAKYLYTDNEASEQIARIRRPIIVFVGLTCQKVHFLTLRLLRGPAKSFVTGFGLLQCNVLSNIFLLQTFKVFPLYWNTFCNLFTQSRKADK